MNDLVGRYDAAAEAMIDMSVPNYRTIDSEDALGACFDYAVELFAELDLVDVSVELKEQAAHVVSQDFLDGLAFAETQKIANEIIEILERNGVEKSMITMVRIPDTFPEDS